MDSKQNWENMGEQMKGALTDALQNGNFKNLNRLVSQTVTTTLNEVGIHITPGNENRQQNDPEYISENRKTSAEADILAWQQRAQEIKKERLQRQQAQALRRQEQVQQQMEQMRQRKEQIRQQAERIRQRQKQTLAQAKQMQQRQVQAQQQAQMQAEQMRQQTQMHHSHKAELALVKIKRVGSVSGLLLQIFGGIGLGVSGIVTSLRLLALTAGGTTLPGWIVNFIFLLFFFALFQIGHFQDKRLKRAERYVSLCSHRMFGEIENLAKSIGKTTSYVVKDLQKMLEIGMFPEGHLDEQNTCFMLNDTVYTQYLAAEDSRKLREKEEKKSLETEIPQGSKVQEQGSELDHMVAEGMEYIRKLRDLNDKISEEAISAKLFGLENLLKDIFDSVRQYPEQMHRMQRLMDYYLPTTLKLVEAYAQFDRVSAPGDDIIKAKAEIANTLDTINQAFTELLNNLFQDVVFDATTDAQVLKTMFAKEGLTREMEFATIRREL